MCIIHSSKKHIYEGCGFSNKFFCVDFLCVGEGITSYATNGLVMGPTNVGEYDVMVNMNATKAMIAFF